MDNLFIVIPAYNEQDTISMVVNEWYEVIDRYSELSRLVVVNDGSKDNTAQILDECAKDRTKMVVLNKKNGGHGSALLAGYQYAIENGADYIFQTDSDGQTSAEEFLPFWDKRQEYDMLIGNRNKREDGFSRIVVTRVLRFVLWLIFGEWVIDANTPYRLMKTSKLKSTLEIMPENYNLPNVIISVVFQRYKYRVLYMPITFRPRQGGINSINLKKICKIGWKALKDFREIKGNMK